MSPYAIAVIVVVWLIVIVVLIGLGMTAARGDRSDEGAKKSGRRFDGFMRR